MDKWFSWLFNDYAKTVERLNKENKELKEKLAAENVINEFEQYIKEITRARIEQLNSPYINECKHIIKHKFESDDGLWIIQNCTCGMNLTFFYRG